MERSEKFWNPYLAGIALGLVLLSSFLIMGKGIGASGAANRIGVAAVNAVNPGARRRQSLHGELSRKTAEAL